MLGTPPHSRVPQRLFRRIRTVKEGKDNKKKINKDNKEENKKI
jgi:hypothetical protein